MSDSESKRDSVTEVAEESFVRERPLEIERGAVLAGRYQVEEIIGKGGSGVVLRVFDRTVQNVVALKVLKSELAREAKWDKRFSRELRLGRPIQHPHVCRIFDIGEADGHRFLTMELASGGSLRDELKRQPALERPLEDRLRDARAAVEGLAAIHGAGVVHRDLKPDNLLRMEDGRLVISDFGLATDAATAPGVTVMIGTPHYMAPEVLAGEPATARSDVWALGVVLHEIFFGRRPERRSVSFDGSRKGPVRPSSATERSLLVLCERCLTENPAQRPADAQSVRDGFEAIVIQGQRRRSLRPRAVWVMIAGISLLSWIGRVFWHTATRGRKLASINTSSSDQSLGSPVGVAANWGAAPVLAEIPGHVYCFSMRDGRTARLIWGDPRRSEDLDLPTGRRAMSDLPAETYQYGCPDLSGGRQPGRLLFTAHNESGASEVRLLEAGDGAESRMIVSGRDPVWINDEDFLFQVDVSHLAIFSLTTMTAALVPNGSLGDAYGVDDKAVARDGRSIAVLFSDFNRNAINWLDGRTGRLQNTWFAQGVSSLGFAGNRLLLSYQRSSEPRTLVQLDGASGSYTQIGAYPFFDVVKAEQADMGQVVLVKRVRTDAWARDDGLVRRLTDDGQTFSVSRRTNGDLLLGRRDDAGRFSVWFRGADGERQLTFGQKATTPAFAPDGVQWAYADYEQKSVLVCSDTDSRQCRPVYKDESLPTRPAFSPDGKKLAIATALRTPRVVVVSVSDGAILGTWDAPRDCGPIWGSAGTVWTLETVGKRYAWAEHEVGGHRTGRRVDASTDEMRSSGQCWPQGVGTNGKPNEVWIVATETSRLARVPLP